MSWEQRNHDFSTAQVDAQVAYIEAEREVKRLQAENARLREQGERLFDKTLELGTENAKLRELVRELWNCAASLAEDDCYHHEGAVLGCGVNCVVNGEDCSAYKLRDRMRELGVER